MNGQPESEQLQNFHERLSQWVAKQGFWFQLRYSLSSGGAKGTFTFHLLRMLVRAGIVVVVVALGFWVYLYTLPNSGGFEKKLSEKLKVNLAAEEMEFSGSERRQGELEIAKLAMIGGEDTFFTDLDLNNLRCEMGIFDSFDKEWDPGLIEISSLEISLRAGADSEESAEAIAKVLFQKAGRVNVDAFQVADTTLRWGYSKRTRGRIVGSKMQVRRVENGWRLMFRGGTFSQNWLKRLEIVELDALVSEDGIVFEKANFKKGEGKVSFSNIEIESGQRPTVSGQMKLSKMDLSYLIPAAARGYLEGSVSGDFEVTGSTNSPEGIGFSGKIELEEEDVIVLRDRIHVLRALSVVDALNDYKRVPFREGSFKLDAHGEEIKISEIDLKADDLLTLAGSFAVRAPTGSEELEILESEEVSATILNEDELEDGDGTLTLKKAAEGSQGDSKIGFKKVEDQSLFDKLGVRVENRLIEERAAELLIKSYRYEGLLEITLKNNAFSRAPLLAESLPVDETTGRIPVKVPIEGSLFELTADQADDVYSKGAR